MKHLDIAVIVLRAQALFCLLSAIIGLTYIPTHLIPGGLDTTSHLIYSRAFFMLDIRIVINLLAAVAMWKYAVPIGRYVIAGLSKQGA